MSNTHELKCRRHFFEAIADGRKPFEFRRDDRDFAEGDTIVLREVERDPGTLLDVYTGRRLERVVTYVLREWPEIGLPEGFVVLGLGVGGPTINVVGDDVTVYFSGEARLGFSPHILVELLSAALLERNLTTTIATKLTEIQIKDGFAMITVRRDYPMNDAGGARQ